MSAAYWQDRYASGGNSGSGSEGLNARFKADYLNRFVKDHEIHHVVEFGCGDGRQLELADYPHYLGLDVAPEAIRLCRAKFEGDVSKSFRQLPARTFVPAGWDLALSLDVIYHLVEDDVYDAHLESVFGAASRFVILYTSDVNYDPFPASAPHVRHRPVTQDVAARFPDWRYYGGEKNPMPGLEGADFFVYTRC